MADCWFSDRIRCGILIIPIGRRLAWVNVSYTCWAVELTEWGGMVLCRTSVGPLLTVVVSAGLFGIGPAIADSGPGLLGSCAERNNPLECVPTKTAATAAEVAYLDNLRGLVKIDDAALLTAGRRTCNMFVYAGETTNQASDDIARSLKVAKASATAVMNSAMMFLCPGLTIGPDGVPRPI